MTTTSDYDTRRVSDLGAEEVSGLRELASALPDLSTAVIDEDPSDAHLFALSGTDLSSEELSFTVIPQRADEFTCSSCYLVQHRSRMRNSSRGLPICADCA
jgi:hypothetical protein